jgi:imidazolonepropionase-like amidohydrolase
VRDGRIAVRSVAAHRSTFCRHAARPVDGKTIIPGLWDMHTHVTQVEWAPVYLGAGGPPCDDMGNEFEFITSLRATDHHLETRPSARASSRQD